jgi:ubinuclein
MRNIMKLNVFFFYSIELASRQLAGGRRATIYAHLADHLPCGKETLIKRAKKLRENLQDDQLKAPIQRLKEGKGHFEF